ncbi:uncharacterized protein LOC62_02G001955 [Vanrija pseudolonga]|uniref:Uncharacterized protein n=1 Tax=Vanrija pseudolonga TaxID=143232 RepID=A0AAF0Y1G7_9TREE|nr:hypothetical protein LOC62_02G001955 [Vanrija pseudolonga]
MPRTYSHLSEAERTHFLEHGWLKIENAIAPKYLHEWMANLWVRLGYDEHDKSTWKEEYLKMPRHREVPVSEFSPVAWAKMCEIVGGEEMIDPVRERYYGDQMIINFGKEEHIGGTHAPSTLKGWHIDNDWYRQFLDSSGNALTVICCFTDVLPDGGGTCLAEDGIKSLVERFYTHPEGIDPPFDDIFGHCLETKQWAQIEAKAGDIFVTHGLLPHAHTPNHKHYARVITNPHINLANPHNLNRADGDYTLCEQVILRNLGRTSVPEYIPTRERIKFYPRTAYFKRERVPEELKRMIADAEARGLDASAVDSVYLRGEDAVKEHERRNGYDKEIGPTGVVRNMDRNWDVFEPGIKRHVLV